MMKKKILISSCGFDQGCSGISQYILENTKAALKQHYVDVLITPKDLKAWPIQHHHQNLIVLPRLFSHPATNTIWHLLILPCWILLSQYIHRSHYDYLFLPAINRRLCAFYPIPCMGTLHDLSQFHVQKKYDFLRMFYIKTVVKLVINANRKLQIVCVSF